jgi:hypothetical protein
VGSAEARSGLTGKMAGRVWAFAKPSRLSDDHERRQALIHDPLGMARVTV